MHEFMQKNLHMIVGVFFTLFGAVFFVIGVALYVAFDRFSETALPVNAVITEITSSSSLGSGRRRRTTHQAYVEYEVDGKRYNERLPSYSSGMREGQELEILYNPDDPSEIDTKNGGLFTLIFVGIGALFFCIGGVLTHIELKKRRRIRRLLSEGRAVTAEVLEIYLDDSITQKIGRRRTHPYRIVCAWTNPVDGVLHEFESDPIWKHPGELSTVTVHIDPADLREYHVAV